MSPYLYIIVMDSLTQMVNRAVALKEIDLHPKCTNPNISSLMFVDDFIFFTKPNSKSLSSINRILNHFYMISGLQENYDKSNILLAGIPSVCSLVIWVSLYVHPSLCIQAAPHCLNVLLLGLMDGYLGMFAKRVGLYC